MKVFIGVPSARFIATDWVVGFINWVAGQSTGWDVTWDFDAKAGRIDWSRSNLISKAKLIKPDWFIQMDTDVLPEISFRPVIDLLNQDKRLGFDAIGSPTTTIVRHDDGTRTLGALLRLPGSNTRGKEAMPFEEPFEVDWIAGGFFAMSQNAVKKITQIGNFGSADTERAYPAYCTNSLEEGEDVNLCRHLRSCGVKVGADARILTTHLKGAHYPSYRPGVGTVNMYEHGDRSTFPVYDSQLATYLAQQKERAKEKEETDRLLEAIHQTEDHAD